MRIDEPGSDPTESSPQLVGNASCEVKGTRDFPARKCRRLARAASTSGEHLGVHLTQCPLEVRKVLDRGRRFAWKRLRAFVRKSSVWISASEQTRGACLMHNEARPPDAARRPRDEGGESFFAASCGSAAQATPITFVPGRQAWRQRRALLKPGGAQGGDPCAHAGQGTAGRG